MTYATTNNGNQSNVAETETDLFLQVAPWAEEAKCATRPTLWKRIGIRPIRRVLRKIGDVAMGRLRKGAPELLLAIAVEWVVGIIDIASASLL